MKRTIAITTMAFVLMSPVAVRAQDGLGGAAPITATVLAGTLGSRSITSVAPLVMNSVAGQSALTTPYAVLVTEITRTGTNPWSVVGALSDDLATTSGSTIAKSAVAVSGRQVLQVASGGVSAAPAGSQDLSVGRTLFTNTGQDVNALYTGTHAATGTVTLTPPNGSAAGVYNGTFTVTLIQ